MMNIFLKQVSDNFSNYFVLMLVDQAGWHKSMELKVPENINAEVFQSMHTIYTEEWVPNAEGSQD
ncbi:MAG: hypothetical protein ACYDHG_02115 [Desulfomonilaceae bacterium]